MKYDDDDEMLSMSFESKTSETEKGSTKRTNNNKNTNDYPERKFSVSKLAINNNSIQNNNFVFSEEDEGIRSQFKPYSELIENLTNSFIINTARSLRDSDDIVACELSKDSNYLVLILKNNDEFYKVQVISCLSFNNTLNIELKGEYIKAAKIA